MWLDHNLFIHLPADGNLLIVLSFWQLHIKVLWIFMYKSLCGHVISFLLSKYLQMEWLGPVGGMCLTFLANCPTVFQTIFKMIDWYPHFTFPLAVNESSRSLQMASTITFANLQYGLSFSHSNRYGLVYYCGFSLCFLSGQWCWTASHVFTVFIFTTYPT